jgi:glycosyltransferase involved in cell wall biosynthesis
MGSLCHETGNPASCAITNTHQCYRDGIVVQRGSQAFCRATCNPHHKSLRQNAVFYRVGRVSQVNAQFGVGGVQPMMSDGLSVVTVVIPALNEERSIPLVLRDLPPVGRVIVVDNGSRDRTAEVAMAAGAQCVRESRQGYGSACLRGLAEIEVASSPCGAAPQVVVFLDADYSDHPDELPLLVAPILADEADFVLGSRLRGHLETGAMPPQSRYGNWLACTLIRWIWGARFTDLGPFRAIRYSALKKLGMQDTDFGWTIEMQIKAIQAGLRIREVPVSYRRRVGVSKISGTLVGTIRAGSKILFTIARYAWRTARSPRRQHHQPTA